MTANNKRGLGVKNLSLKSDAFTETTTENQVL